MRRFAHLSIVALCLIILASCNSPTKNSDPTVSSTVAPTSPAVRLRPPDFTLKSDTSTQAAIQGAYYWQLENGLAVDVKSGGFTLAEATPIKVSQGQQLTVTGANGPYPEKMDLKIYPEEGNVHEVKVTATAVNAFQPTTEPLDEQSFTNTPYELNIDLPKGHYFIWMSGTWKNPFTRAAATETSVGTPTGTPAPIKPLTDQIAFWIDVQ